MKSPPDIGITLSEVRPTGRTTPYTPGRATTLPAVVLPVFSVTIVLASGLLFLVQPMFARMVLPKLGGSPAVWSTCVLFFQTVLLLGYLYAHLSTKWLGVRRQALLHAFVILLPLLSLPIDLGSVVPGSSDQPVRWLLSSMAVSVGVPFFVLSTTSPLLQRWVGALPVAAAKDPYFLYAGSNLGSLAALVAYPFVVEPVVGLANQARLWAAGYVLLIASLFVCAWAVRTRSAESSPAAANTGSDGIEVLSTSRRFQWLLLAFVPSSLMLGVTTHITTDLAAVPLLWIIPLAAYLVTFILAFSSWRPLGAGFGSAAGLSLVLFCLGSVALNAHQWWLMPLHFAAFFCCALACHYRLADTRPGVAHLTEFYVWLSVGGMLGGVLNTVVAPAAFNAIYEYPVMLAVVPLLLPLGRSVSKTEISAAAGAAALVLACLLIWFEGSQPVNVAMFLLAVCAGISATMLSYEPLLGFRCLSLALVALIVIVNARSARSVLFADRSFFGVVRVLDAPDHTFRILMHGSTNHGRQEWPAEGACDPAGYYDRRGPLGSFFAASAGRFSSVAVLGLGTGGLACYAEPGQRWSFFEIDPLVARVANDPTLFRHLENSRGTIDVVIADGRIAMQRSQPATYNLIVADAFSSDSIPVHLVTEEALAMYKSRLRHDGILAVHISNRYLELEPVVAAIAERQGLVALANIQSDIPESERAEGRLPSHWVVLAEASADLSWITALPGWRPAEKGARSAVWTDDYSNIFRVLKFN